MNFSLQQRLETATRFMYQKRNAIDFTYFDNLVSEISDDAISDLPKLKEQRQEVLKKYFRENNIPEIIINGSLVTDFDEIAKISSISSSIQSSFEPPVSNTKKKPFSHFESEHKKSISSNADTLNSSLRQLISEAISERDSSNGRTLSGINYIYYPKIKDTLRDFYISFGKVAAEYKDPRFAIPKLFESNGISTYRDSEGNLLDFKSIVSLSRSVSR